MARALQLHGDEQRSLIGDSRAVIGIRWSTDEQLDRYGPDVQREADAEASRAVTPVARW